MSSGDKVDSPASSETVSPSNSAKCSHCGSLFVHMKGCRYCLPAKNRKRVLLKANKKAPPKGEKKRVGSDVKRLGMHCVVPCCTNATNKPPRKIFFYPTVVSERKKLWLKTIGIRTMKTKVVICEEHFDLEADIENYIKFKYYPTKWNRLKKTAIPTKFPCQAGKTGPYPKHEHVFIDLSKVKLQGPKKREYPNDHSEAGVLKKRKVVASGAIPSTKFGHPPESRSTTVAHVEIVQNEPENPVSLRDKFDFLNGDISNLIAHVQPSICSWDVSVVDVHSPSPSVSKDCGPACPKSNVEEPIGPEENGGSNEEDESETENEDYNSEKEQENENGMHLENAETKSELGPVNTRTDQGSVEPQLLEKEDAKVEQSSRVASSTEQRYFEDDNSSEISATIIEEQNSDSCDADDGVDSEPCTTISIEPIDEGSIIPAGDDKQKVSDLCAGELSVNDVETGELTISTQEKSDLPESEDLNDEGITPVESELDGVQKLDPSRSSKQGGVTSSDGAESSNVEATSHPAEIIHKSGSKSYMPSVASSMDCKIADSRRSSPEEDSLKETQRAMVVDDKTSTSEVESDNSRMKVDSTQVKPPEKAVMNSSSVSGTNSEVVTSLPSSLRKPRVSNPNCSCVMCGGTSDAEDDSGSGNLSKGSISEIEAGGTGNVLAIGTPAISMRRIFKKVDEIEQKSDVSEELSEYFTGDESPETIESDSDSEWTPNEEERRFVPTRTTRNRVNAQKIAMSRKTRSSEKAENPADDSPSEDAEIDSEWKDDRERANTSSLKVNMSETVASYTLKKTTYSYKQLYEGGESNEETAGPKRSDKVLVVRNNEDDEFNAKAPLPQPMVDLLENMKTYFDHFFEKLDKLKQKIATGLLDSEESRRAEQYVETLEEDVKMFPALLNLEMVQFVLKCKQHYQKKMEDLGERFKKIRWCAICPEAALFHCCFKAAYCSCKCQRKHWDEHKKECAQENVNLLDPHLRLNTSLMLRVRNLNRTKVTISDLEKVHNQPRSDEETQKTVQPHRPSKNIEKESEPREEDPTTSLAVGKRKSLNSHAQKPVIKTYPARQRRHSNSTPKTNGSMGGAKNTQRDIDRAELKVEQPEDAVPAKRFIKSKPLVSKTPKDASKTVVSTQKKNETFLSTFAVKQSPAVNITLSPQFLSSLSGSSLQLNSRTTTVASSTGSKATLPTASLLLPKSVLNVGGIVTTSSGSTNQVVVKFKSVTLPNGEKRLIPADMPVDQAFVRANTSPSSGKPATSGSILITRPAKPAYTAHTGFIPLGQVTPSSTQPLFLQQGVSGILTPLTSPMISQAPVLSMVPPLPTLTPIPKQGSCSVRTLNEDELNKILNTDHLQSAFDDSYYANTRIRS